ncbi:MAG: 2-phosphoglycolate phosphatase [Psychrobacter glaciei]|jgi:2-phosphoglycolate phosphatase
MSASAKHSVSTFKAVLFDLDGTLIDTAPDFIVCLNDLRAEYNLPPLANLDIRKVVSDGARAMVSLAFEITEGDEGFEQKKQQFLDLYSQNICRESRLFDSLDDLLNWCDKNKIPWGIVTNKPRRFSELLLKKLNLETRLSSLVCADDVENPKPNAEPMLKACQELNVKPEDCLYVGDHQRDIDAGKNANMKTIAAAYGYVHNIDEAESWLAHWTVNTSLELTQLLSKLLKV